MNKQKWNDMKEYNIGMPLIGVYASTGVIGHD